MNIDLISAVTKLDLQRNLVLNVLPVLKTLNDNAIMTSIAVNRNLWSVLCQHRENVVRSIERHIIREPAFANVVIQNNIREFYTSAFQSQLELEQRLSKRQLKFLFKTLQNVYTAPILIKLKSSDRHEILAIKLFQLATIMVNDVTNIVQRPQPLAVSYTHLTLPTKA